MSTTGNAMEQNWQMFVMTGYVYAIQVTYKMKRSATKVKHFKFMVICIIFVNRKYFIIHVQLNGVFAYY